MFEIAPAPKNNQFSPLLCGDRFAKNLTATIAVNTIAMALTIALVFMRRV